MPSGEDFWADIDLRSQERFPIDVLKAQADLLGKKTDGVLKGVVERTTDDEIIYLTLYIEAPSVNDYRYALIKTASTSKPYPVFIYDNSRDDEAIKVQKPRKILTNPFALNTAMLAIWSGQDFFGTVEEVGKSIPEPDITATNLKEFEEGIRRILSSRETSAVVHSLLAQSKKGE